MTPRSAARRAAVTWATDAALPFWAKNGWDEISGGFVERLDEHGRPDMAAPRRTRVQARQIYVYAHAALLGWYDPARDLALKGLAWWLDHCRPADGGPGFIHIVAPNGEAIDSRIDAYDQAFSLMALAWVFRLTGDAQIRRLIDEQIAFLDEAFADRAVGGWRESLPDALPRRQNPHMHAFEAMLCLYEATNDPAYLKRAEGFLALLRGHFIDPRSGVLREYFDASLRPSAEPEHDIAEPGHHFEWTWILLNYARLSGQAPPPEAHTLYRWAEKHGLNTAGFAVDELHVDGRPRRASRRLWPQTELIKANLALQEAGLDDRAAARADSVLGLLGTYFTDEPRGGWVDRFDGNGALVDSRMWASSFYHIFRSITEADRVV